MNDNNFRDIIGARLEEIHMAETMPETMPSEADMLRWETLAKARTADRKRKMRRFISIAAVFLLAVVIGVAVIVGPPDAEAGGEGNAVIVEGGMEIMEFDNVKYLPAKLKMNFVVVDGSEYGFELMNLKHTKGKNSESIEIYFERNNNGEIILTEIKGKENTTLKNDFNSLYRKEYWGDAEVFIVKDIDNKDEKTYNFIYNNLYISIFTKGVEEGTVKEMIEEAF